MPALTTSRVMLGNRRKTGKEQYYTPAELALELIQEAEAYIGPLHGRTILEPAGGTGSFVQAALMLGASEVISFDIEPLHRGVLHANFLEQEIEQQNLVTISNPPFGRNNSLSIPFFNKAALVSDAICFIVPRSWRKWSVINRLNEHFVVRHDRNLEIDYVDSNGEQISPKNRLATCFQVWQRTETPRARIEVEDLGIVKKVEPEMADVSLTIFGYGCGKLKTEFERKPNSTQMFLKLNHPRAKEALEKVDFSRFYKNTAYTEALALAEINYLLNEFIFGDPMIRGI